MQASICWGQQGSHGCTAMQLASASRRARTQLCGPAQQHSSAQRPTRAGLLLAQHGVCQARLLSQTATFLGTAQGQQMPTLHAPPNQCQQHLLVRLANLRQEQTGWSKQKALALGTALQQYCSSGTTHRMQKAARCGPTYAQQLLLCPSWMHMPSLAAQRSNVPGTMSSALAAKTHTYASLLAVWSAATSVVRTPLSSVPQCPCRQEQQPPDAAAQVIRVAPCTLKYDILLMPPCHWYLLRRYQR